MSERRGSVEQIEGARNVQAALLEGRGVELVLLLRESTDPELERCGELAALKSIPVRSVSGRVLQRMGRSDPTPVALALVGRTPGAALEDVLAQDGAVWLLTGVEYPGNIGMALRTAEVSGARGAIVDGELDRDERRFALRVSVRSDWYMPVFWEPVGKVLDLVRGSGRRMIGIEDVGAVAPWEVDLTGPVLFIVGGERRGVGKPILEVCDEVVRIPMAGFIPSYNLQAAVAVLAAERLRQLDLSAGE